MNVNLIIVDDFYQNPDNVRNYALKQEFPFKGRFPGVRTAPYLPDDLKVAISHHMQFAGGVTDWCPHTGSTGSFQLVTAEDKPRIHTDFRNMWAAVCYLTPNAPHTSGTGFFRHRATGEHSRMTSDHEYRDYDKWDLFDVVGNRYNRLVIYRADLFHASLGYFGSTPEDGRLFQTFFFNTAHY